MKKIPYILIAVLVITLLVSCSSSKKNNVIASNAKVEGTFKIQALNKKDISTEKLTLTFNTQEKSINGFAGCNNFFGSYFIEEGDKLSFGVLAATEMYCEGPIMNIEDSLFKTLKDVTTYTYTENTLILYSKTGDQLLISTPEQ